MTGSKTTCNAVAGNAEYNVEDFLRFLYEQIEKYPNSILTIEHTPKAILINKKRKPLEVIK